MSIYQRSRAYRWLFWHGVPFLRDDTGLTIHELRWYIDRYKRTAMTRKSP